MSKPLNIGMVGYGFMGRTHSNAYRKVTNFFNTEYKPVLKAVCARDEAKVRGQTGSQGRLCSR
jgi:predicted dehydrogenase